MGYGSIWFRVTPQILSSAVRREIIVVGTLLDRWELGIPMLDTK